MPASWEKKQWLLQGQLGSQISLFSMKIQLPSLYCPKGGGALNAVKFKCNTFLHGPDVIHFSPFKYWGHWLARIWNLRLKLKISFFASFCSTIDFYVVLCKSEARNVIRGLWYWTPDPWMANFLKHLRISEVLTTHNSYLSQWKHVIFSTLENYVGHSIKGTSW